MVEKKQCCCGEEKEVKGGCCGEEKEVKSGCCGGHEHDHGHGGCCGENGHHHDHDHDHEHDVPVLHLELDDGTEMACFVLEILDIEDKSYIALLPEEEETFMIYEYKEEGEEVSLANIESDEEYEEIAKVFEAHFDAAEEEE